RFRGRTLLAGFGPPPRGRGQTQSDTCLPLLLTGCGYGREQAICRGGRLRANRATPPRRPVPLAPAAVSAAPDIFIKQYLMTAGPTPLPPAVSQVMAEPVPYHRSPAFVEVYARVLKNLRTVFQTRNDVLCFAASGTGGMESAVATLVVPGERVVVASAGKFGERWNDICNAYGARTTRVTFEWGGKLDPDRGDAGRGEGG